MTDLKTSRRDRAASNGVLDRLPPYAPEAEQAIIGCCLNTPVESISESQAALSPESFYDLRNQNLWKAIIALPLASVNAITVRQAIKDAGIVIDDFYLADCQDKAFSSAHLPVWLKEVQEKQILRAVIKTCAEAAAKAYQSNDATELLDEIERDVLAIRPAQRNTGDIKSLVMEAQTRIERRILEPHSMTGLSTGLHDLDKLTDGLHKGEMIVLCAFPSCGKTALAVNIAVFNAIRKTPCAIFSAEMRPVQLVVRSICSESRVNFYKVCDADTHAMKQAGVALAASPLHIEQASRLSIGQVMAIARRQKQKHNIQLVVVDYIQLLTGHGDNREQEISSISKGIKAMALELDLPVLALSQLTDDGKLRESRAIGQDADSVWMLASDGDWKPDIQPVTLTVQKCRDGATGKVPLIFAKTYTKFENESHD